VPQGWCNVRELIFAPPHGELRDMWSVGGGGQRGWVVCRGTILGDGRGECKRQVDSVLERKSAAHAGDICLSGELEVNVQ
jgi:hypothetical protein